MKSRLQKDLAMTAMAIEHPHKTLFSHLSSLLADRFVIANFGSSNDRGHELPAEIRQLITLIEIDANAGSQIAEKHYGRIIRVLKGIAAQSGVRNFYIARCAAASSLLPCDRELVAQYGMEPFLETLETRQVECVTVEDVLQQNNVGRLDFLKTDLEGIDFEVIKSCEPHFDEILAIQAELRFQPFFKGEPHFHEVAGYLAEHGYELVGLNVERWKYNTPYRDRQRKGRAVWADAVFFKTPTRVMQDASEPSALAKQIILAAMLKHENYAEFLLDQYQALIPEPCAADLKALIAVRASSRSEMLSADFPHAAIE
jgi:FkbM family methyltransferase